MPPPTPAVVAERNTEVLIELARTEGRILTASRCLADVNVDLLTRDEREMLALAKETVGDLVRTLDGRMKERALDVRKSEVKAMTRRCVVGGMQPHYWLDEPGRGNAFPASAEPYAHAIEQVCPHHQSGARSDRW